jgi:glycerol uptake facilitator-like aquaporin
MYVINITLRKNIYSLSLWYLLRYAQIIIHKTMKLFVGEFIGTFILSATINFILARSTDPSPITTLYLIGGLFVAVQASRKLSGGHLNPGVTFTFYLSDLFQKKEGKCIMYYLEMFAGQLVGAFLPAIICQLSTGSSANPAPPSGNYITALVMEAIGSTIFYSTILHQSKPEENITSGDDALSSLVIASGLGIGKIISENVSGAGLNPAIVIGLNLTYGFFTGNFDTSKWLPVFILAPLLGSLLANFVCMLTSSNKYEKEEKGEETA